MPVSLARVAHGSGPRAQPGAATALDIRIRLFRHEGSAMRPTVSQSGPEGHLISVRGLLITIITTVTAGSAGLAAGFVTAARVASSGSSISMVAAVAAGLVATVTTALAVASALHKLIKRE
jgi:hypothetical protein